MARQISFAKFWKLSSQESHMMYITKMRAIFRISSLLFSACLVITSLQNHVQVMVGLMPYVKQPIGCIYLNLNSIKTILH